MGASSVRVAAALLSLSALATCGDSGSAAGAGGEGTGGSGGSGSQASFEGAWRPVSLHLTALNFASPADSVEHTVELPSEPTEPILGVPVQMLMHFGAGTRTTYVRSPGQDTVARIVDPLTVNGSDAFAGGDFLSLDAGRIVMRRADNVAFADGGSTLLSSELFFERVGGEVPPADWPDRIVDVP